MMGHNICFKGVIRKIIPKLPFNPFLSGALVQFGKRQMAGVLTKLLKVAQPKF